MHLYIDMIFEVGTKGRLIRSPVYGTCYIPDKFFGETCVITAVRHFNYGEYTIQMESPTNRHDCYTWGIYTDMFGPMGGPW